MTSDNANGLVCNLVLESIPHLPLHQLDDEPGMQRLLHPVSCFFRSLLYVDWLTYCLAGAIQALCQRTDGLGSLGRECEWKKEMASRSFESLVDRLSLLHRSSMWEVCRIRTETEFNERYEARSRASKVPLVYTVRIVCQEGAIVRNGIE